MSKKACMIIAVVMLIVAVIFVIYALNNPQLAFRWSNTITYIIYLVYLVVMAAFFIAYFRKKS